MSISLQELSDRREIEDLMVRYADRIDANDPDGAAACFAPDGIGNYWGVERGREAIAERLRGILRSFNATSHHLTNLQLQLNGDEATAQSYVYAFHRLRKTGKPMHYWGRWVDSLVRLDGEWLFAERTVVGIGSMNPGDPQSDQEHLGHPGRLPHS